MKGEGTKAIAAAACCTATLRLVASWRAVLLASAAAAATAPAASAAMEGCCSATVSSTCSAEGRKSGVGCSMARSSCTKAAGRPGTSRRSTSLAAQPSERGSLRPAAQRMFGGQQLGAGNVLQGKCSAIRLLPAAASLTVGSLLTGGTLKQGGPKAEDVTGGRWLAPVLQQLWCHIVAVTLLPILQL